MEEISWIMPLLLLPGVALLLMSTSIRFGQIHDEIHHILDEEHKPEVIFAARLEKRSLLFRNALVSLYISVAAFAVGSMSGAVLSMFDGPDEWAVISFACIGIAMLLFAAVELIRESVLSLKVIQKHLDDIMEDVELELTERGERELFIELSKE